ncbi:nickel-dependent hydrogenase large subunit [Desulfotignum balticum]|uniref:nickel-dependent hydrogenase large subunit n=1 Tax=Desulfotignum balticum TaxID=115781 RepID=UPI00042813E9|nr:nickel-dependent hydrogenase large subunit [Desulfotignum balticum]
MGQRILIDPITRIEGHLRIEVEVENCRVKDAWSSGQMFRGIEMMLKGRDPRDAHHFVQRSCGVCTYVHALSSARAVEAACNNTTYLAYGDFPRKGVDDDLLLPGGVLMGDLTPKPLDTNLITEDVTRGWYEPGESRHPYQGETKPIPAEVTYNTDDKYSWIKAPRYDGRSAEVGPMARNLVAYTRGQKDVKQLVDHVLSTLGVGTEALFSTLGRTAARGIETAVVGNAMETWIDELRTNIARGDKEIYQPWTMPDTGMGYGLNDVPRGALGHWIEIDKGMIKNYQYVVPSTWNLGPRDAQNQKGPVENSLIGTPVADPKQPLEILRTVHSYDPCIACAIHVIDPHTNETYKVRVI